MKSILGQALFTPLAFSIYNKIKGQMWRAVGTISHQDDKSVRSNRSRLDGSPQQFHHNKSASRSPQKSFCYEYFQKKRESGSKIRYQSRALSEKSLKMLQNNNDLFTSLRHFSNKQETQESLITAKNNPLPSYRSNQATPKNNQSIKQASSKIRNLKRDQKKLKETIQNQFVVFKNMFLQIEDRVHQQQLKTKIPKQKGQSVGGQDLQFLKDIFSEAAGIQKYFMELDRKKQEILSRLSSS